MNKTLSVIFLSTIFAQSLFSCDLPPEKTNGTSMKPFVQNVDFPHQGGGRKDVAPSVTEFRTPSPMVAVGCFLMSVKDLVPASFVTSQQQVTKVIVEETTEELSQKNQQQQDCGSFCS